MDYKLLSQSPVFRGISESETGEIFSSLPHRLRKFRSGAHIAQSGEPVNSFLIVTEGTVKGEMIDFAGRVIKIEDIPAPGTLASAFIFGNRNRFPVNVVALTDAEILIIDKNDFLRLMIRNDRILVNFLDMISNRSQFLSEKIKFLNFRTIKGKLAQYILQIAAGRGGSVRLERTQNDLADFFGVARPSISRSIREMEDEGLIIAHGKEITILDEKRLTQMTFE